MSQDISALQYLYGAAQDSADDIYILSLPLTDASEVPERYADFEQHAYDNSYLSIVDNGGYNVLYSPLAVAQ